MSIIFLNYCHISTPIKLFCTRFDVVRIKRCRPFIHILGLELGSYTIFVILQFPCGTYATSGDKAPSLFSQIILIVSFLALRIEMLDFHRKLSLKRF